MMLLSYRPFPVLTRVASGLTCVAATAVLLLSGAANVHGQTQPAPQTPGPQLHLQRLDLSAGVHRIDAQVAQAPHERQIGLMNRPTMPQHEGMLFVFEQPAKQCFWMKNTLLPLTAAFVADDGTIVNLADMQPHAEASHCSAKPVRYVLEMNQGWFDKKGLKAGSRLQGAPFSAAKP